MSKLFFVAIKVTDTFEMVNREIEVIKETPKQFTIQENRFDYRTRINKSELGFMSTGVFNNYNTMVAYGTYCLEEDVEKFEQEIKEMVRIYILKVISDGNRLKTVAGSLFEKEVPHDTKI